MGAVNPAFIPRNHLVEEALSAAVNNGDLSAFETLLTVLLRPYDEQPDRTRYADPPRPDQIVRQTFLWNMTGLQASVAPRKEQKPDCYFQQITIADREVLKWLLLSPSVAFSFRASSLHPLLSLRVLLQQPRNPPPPSRLSSRHARRPRPAF